VTLDKPTREKNGDMKERNTMETEEKINVAKWVMSIRKLRIIG
jgi:hypothetical protein